MYVPDTVRLRFEWKKIGSEAGRRLRRLFELRSNYACLTRYRIALNGNKNKEAILERGVFGRSVCERVYIVCLTRYGFALNGSNK